MSNSSSGAYCGAFEDVVSSYANVHGYVSISVCVAGAVSTGLSLVVLSALAAADALVMLEYVPFSLHQYVMVDRPQAERFSYAWAVYVLFHAIFTQV
jgi:hypothetical protein